MADGGGTPDPATPAGPSFEQALAELEGVVAQLEAGDMPLEQALVAFEAGVKLSRRCAATLDAAERRIEILMAGRPGASPRVAPFGAAGGGGDALDEELEVDGDGELDEIDELEADGDHDPVEDPQDERRTR